MQDSRADSIALRDQSLGCRPWTGVAWHQESTSGGSPGRCPPPTYLFAAESDVRSSRADRSTLPRRQGLTRGQAAPCDHSEIFAPCCAHHIALGAVHAHQQDVPVRRRRLHPPPGRSQRPSIDIGAELLTCCPSTRTDTYRQATPGRGFPRQGPRSWRSIRIMPLRGTHGHRHNVRKLPLTCQALTFGRDLGKLALAGGRSTG